MPNLSPENVIIGLQNNLEALRAEQAHFSDLSPEYQAATAAEHKFAGRVQKQDRRVSLRRKAKAARLPDTVTSSHAAPPPQERGE